MRSVYKLLLLSATALGISLLLLNGLQTYASPSDADLDREIERVFDDLDMTAMTIAVVHNDSVIYIKSMGYRVLPDESQKGDTVSKDDMYCLASVSKTFIATTIMRLVDDRKIKLNDAAEKFLSFKLRNPNSPSVPITIKQLLTHTSGLQDLDSKWNPDSVNPKISHNYTRFYLKHKQYKYCNLNYSLLGRIIEGVTKRPLDTVIDSLILEPLDIKGGFNTILLDKDRIVTPYYHGKDGKWLINDYVIKRYPMLLPGRYELQKSDYLTFAPAGMKISAGDLAKFMMMHINHGILNGQRVIKAKSAREMRHNYVGANNYGLSFRQYDDLIEGKTLQGQTGGIEGMKTCMIFEPENNTGYVILTAGAKSKYIDGYGDIHKPLIRALYKHLIENDSQRQNK